MTRLMHGLLVLIFLITAGLIAWSAGISPPLAAEEIPVIQPLDTGPKTVAGRVETSDGTPVANALVIAYRVNRFLRRSTLTGADGRYELQLAPGLWALRVEPTDSSEPAGWVYPREAQRVEFGFDDTAEKQEVNFTVLPAGASVAGVVAMPDGSVPPFPVVVSLRNGEGLGGRTLIRPDSGAFALTLPAGRYEVFIQPQNDGYAGPRVEPVTLRPGAKVDFGILKLLARSGVIEGVVRDEKGNPAAGMPVVAWQGDRADLFRTRTGDDGRYRLKVIPGVWHVRPAPGPDQPYLYVGRGQRVAVKPGETVAGIDFEVLAADATIAGVLVTEDGRPVLEIGGWATAESASEPKITAGGPIRAGKFKIHVPGGSYAVSVHLAPGTPYLPLGPVKAEVKSGETITVRVPVRLTEAAIRGALVDPRQDRQPVTGVAGRVTAWSGRRWATAPIRPESGSYRLRVAAGIWRLNYQIASDEYVKLGGPANLPVEAGQTVAWPLPVTRRDGGIAGTVLDPDGRPLAGAVVMAQGLGGEIGRLRLHTRTDAGGRFRLALPHGRYRVGAPGGEPGWINPVDLMVGVAPGSVAGGLVLKFREPNAFLAGNLTVKNTSEEGNVVVWAWTERGAFNFGRFPVAQLGAVDPPQAGGPYRLGVIAGATWQIGAVFETDEAFWIARTRIEPVEGANPLDLVLEGPFLKPPPLAVTFDAAEAQRLVLADGTEIFIPAGALPAEGEVTLRIIPLASLPQQPHARVIRYGYAFHATDEAGRPLEERFNHHVVIRFPFNPGDLAGRWPHLKPAYFSTTTNEWTIPVDFHIDPAQQVVVMEIDHFTDFALVEGVPVGEAYLPAVNR